MKKSVLCLILVLMIPCFANASFFNEKEDTLTSGKDDQETISLTIYNVDLGLIKDIRNISLPKGTFELQFMDVAANIIPSSVTIKSLNKGEADLQVLEQNYVYDLMSPDKLLEKYVGKEIKLYSQNPATGKDDIKKATVLAVNNGTILQMGKEITYNYPGRFIFPSVPADLITKPTLVWTLNNNGKQQKVEVSYLTSNINWSADYVMTLSKDDIFTDLSGWVSINNRSGATYEDAKLKLVAGDVQRVTKSVSPRDRFGIDEDVSQFTEKDFFEYHIYNLKRPTTIKNNQQKQVSFVKANNIPVTKNYIYNGEEYFYRSRNASVNKHQKVAVYIKIQNKKRNNLGIPLPQGIIRVYKHDNDGNLQFIGEDNINHVSNNGDIIIKLGKAFDVIGERKQVDWKKIGDNTYKATYKVTLSNHKMDDILVTVIEPLPGSWEISETSHEFNKTNSSTAEFEILVPANKDMVIDYTVIFTY